MHGSLGFSPREEDFSSDRPLLLTFGQFGRKETGVVLKVVLHLLPDSLLLRGFLFCQTSGVCQWRSFCLYGAQESPPSFLFCFGAFRLCLRLCASFLFL